MSCHIYATLEKGLPTLEIVDADNQQTLVHWQYTAQHPERTFEHDDVLSLFRQLILLTCKQQAASGRVFTAQSRIADVVC